MSASESSLFPLVGLQVVANAHNEWVALSLQLSHDAGDAVAALTTLFADTDACAVLAPLDCIIPIADPLAIGAALLAVLPAQRILFAIPAALCAEPPVQARCRALADQGYRILVDGGASLAGQAGARAFSCDAAAELPPALQLMALPGPHLARNVDTDRCLAQCRALGFGWFAGDYALHAARDGGASDDGTSRKRLLALLGLLARDADSWELETLLKQDPALSYHLLRLVNSAAFAMSKPINNFVQAINMLGRRQLQRWLQLLLYARQQDDGVAHALLPLAAVRAAQMEALCKMGGGNRDAQDLAFMAGAFSLLDALLGMPMSDIVGVLNLDAGLEQALLRRAGPFGQMLALTEQHSVHAGALRDAGIDTETHWRSLLQAYHWAIQVSRNL